MRQFLINFCENRAIDAVFASIRNESMYGNAPCTRWAYQQERFWNRLTEWLEGE